MEVTKEKKRKYFLKSLEFVGKRYINHSILLEKRPSEIERDIYKDKRNDIWGSTCLRCMDDKYIYICRT